MRGPGGHERERVLRNIRGVSLLDCDPVFGKSGPLLDHWRAPNRG
jgi:uncharacterized protein YjlB